MGDEEIFSPTYARHKDDAARDEAERGQQLGGRARGVDRGGRPEVGEQVGEGAREGGARKEVAPLLVHHARHHALLRVRAHHDAEQEDHEGGDGVHGERVRLGLAQLVALRVPVGVLGARLDGLRHGVVQEVAHLGGLDEHAALKRTKN